VHYVILYLILKIYEQSCTSILPLDFFRYNDIIHYFLMGLWALNQNVNKVKTHPPTHKISLKLYNKDNITKTSISSSKIWYLIHLIPLKSKIG